MYFYTISEGSYSDTIIVNLVHDKNFSNIEFAKMYNDTIGERDSMYIDDLSELMVERFGFKIVKSKIEINTDYGYCKKLNLDNFNHNKEYYQINWRIE